MSPGQARDLVHRLLGEIAPDADPTAVGADEDLGEALDLDSMDRLNLVAAVSEAIAHDIPDVDAARLRTLADWEAYLADAPAA